MKNLKFLFSFLTIIAIVLIISSCESNLNPIGKKDSQFNMAKFKEHADETIKLMGLQKVSGHDELRSSVVCQDPNVGFNCVGPFTRTYTIIYEGCPFTVEGEIYICANIVTGDTYFVIGEQTNLSWDWFTNPDCLAWLNTVLTLWFQGNTELLNDEIDTWQYALEQGWESQFVSNYIQNNPSNSYYCDLPEIDANIIVDNYRGVCYQRCFNNPVEGGQFWTDIRCGFGCCKRTTEYCIDRRTGEIATNTKVEIITACNRDPEPYPGCGFLTECRETCSKIR